MSILFGLETTLLLLFPMFFIFEILRKGVPLCVPFTISLLLFLLLLKIFYPFLLAFYCENVTFSLDFWHL